MGKTLRESLIRLSGKQGKEIADRLDVTPDAVYRVIKGLSRSARIELEIARIVGIKPTLLFPPAHHRKGVEKSHFRNADLSEEDNQKNKNTQLKS